MDIAIYARVSTGRQAEEGVSLASQVQQIESWAKTQEHTIVETYLEKGATGTDDRRAEFQRMIEDATSTDHPFDAVVVFSLSRFFRDSIELGLYERKLARHKVHLISITQPTSEDDAGKMVRQIIASFDEYSSRENGKNVRTHMIKNAQLGFFNGSQPPFGYTAIRTETKGRNGYKRKLEISSEEAEIVRTIFHLATKGISGEPYGIKKIADHLNNRGIRFRGKNWIQQQVWKILSSTVYYGEYIFNRIDSRNRVKRAEKDWITVAIPAIISKEEFQLAAAQRSERAPGGTVHQSKGSLTLLTGIAKCAKCGSSFVLMTGKSGKFNYYQCSTRKNQGINLCDAPNIPKEELDAIILETVANKVLVPGRIVSLLAQLSTRIAEIQKPDRDREKHLQRQNALLTEKINNWLNMTEEGKIELHKSLLDRLAAMQQQMDTHTQELVEISKRRQLPLKKFGESQIHSFSEEVRAELFTKNSKFARSYLKGIVSEIRISGTSGTIKGNIADMAAAISSYRAGTPLMVPRHLSKWCARSDSNARPLGS